MKYFPDVSNFDLNTTGGLALYGAHCDLDPVLGLIEQTIMSLNATRSLYIDMGNEADKSNDFFAQSEYMNLLGVFSSEIVPLAYETLLTIMVSRLEEAFNGWCRIIAAKDTRLPPFDEFRKERGSLDNAIEYLKKYGNINGIKNDCQWEYIKAIRDARNMIMHNGARVHERKREIMDRFKIGMCPEDYRLYLEEDTIKNMYKAITQFIDRVFLITPENG